jgi:hypothetical protein
MIDYNYNGMNAQDIANRIISNEEAYENADYNLMPFDVKCYYALAHTPIIHLSVSPDRTKRTELLNSLHPELLRLAQEEDAFALYVLGSTNADLSAPATDDERRFLERSMNAGHVPAALSLLDRFYYGKKREAPEAKRIISWLAEHINEDTPAEERYSYYSLIGDKKREMELALRFAIDGDYSSVIRLTNHLGNSLDLNSESRAFWETVEFLVLKHFYDKGATHLGDRLGMKLINERGCERDIEKIKEIYVDLLLNYEYDRKNLIEMVCVPRKKVGDDIHEAERVCRYLIKNGNETDYWRLILIALLSGDRKKLEEICDEACRVREGILVPKAYHMLKHAKAKD